MSIWFPGTGSGGERTSNVAVIGRARYMPKVVPDRKKWLWPLTLQSIYGTKARRR